MGNNHVVYAHKDNEGIRYIGSGDHRRPYVFSNRSKGWYDAFPSGFPSSIEILVHGLTKDEAMEFEKAAIEQALHENCDLVNIRSGEGKGNGWIDGKNHLHYRYGKNLPQEVRDKIKATKAANPDESVARYWLGKKRDPEIIKKLVKAGHSAEARKKRSETMTGRKLSEDHKKKISEGNMGKNLTESHRQAISEAKKGKDNGLKGRVMPEEHRKKISLSHMGKKMPRSGVEKHRKAMTGRASPKRKKVRCIDTGEVYDCAKIAAQQTGSSEKGIQRVCGSDPSRTRHNGFQWEYVE